VPVVIQVGQTGTLRFLPTQAGLDPALVATVVWQLQGTPPSLTFTAPDRIEGIAEGMANMRCAVTMVGGSDRLTYRFEVQTTPSGLPAPPKVIPVALDIAPPSMSPP
jgi:hypothetical protein